MPVRNWIRDVTLLAFAAGVGWWLRGAEKPVYAQRGTGDNLAFEMLGTGPESTLVLYNRDTRSLYVYAHAAAGASQVPCTYSFLVKSPGEPLERTNCAVGNLR